jgi:hypothetical protein
MKRCTKCKIEKSISEFWKDSAQSSGLRPICRVCSSKYYFDNREERLKQNKIYYKRNRKRLLEKYHKDYKEIAKKRQAAYRLINPQVIKDRSLRTIHGITLKDYNRLLEQQGGICAICGQEEIGKDRNGEKKVLSVDHNHKTGKIRGLLCSKCNHGIGLMRENIKILTNAINYLKFGG